MSQKYSQYATSLLLVLAVGLSGCVPRHKPVHGEKDNPNDPSFSKYPGSEELEDLAGKDEEKPSAAKKGDETVDKTKARPVRLRGRVMVDDPRGDYPLKEARIGLISSDNVLMGDTTTSGSGYFTLSGKFKSGRYRLKVLSGSFSSSHTIDIDGESIDDIEVRVEKQQSEKKAIQ